MMHTARGLVVIVVEVQNAGMTMQQSREAGVQGVRPARGERVGTAHDLHRLALLA